MENSLDAPIHLVFTDGTTATVTVRTLHALLFDTFAARVAGDDSDSNPLLPRLADVVRAEAPPEAWAALMWLAADTLHRE